MAPVACRTFTTWRGRGLSLCSPTCDSVAGASHSAARSRPDRLATSNASSARRRSASGPSSGPGHVLTPRLAVTRSEPVTSRSAWFQGDGGGHRGFLAGLVEQHGELVAAETSHDIRLTCAAHEPKKVFDHPVDTRRRPRSRNGHQGGDQAEAAQNHHGLPVPARPGQRVSHDPKAPRRPVWGGLTHRCFLDVHFRLWYRAFPNGR